MEAMTHKLFTSGECQCGWTFSVDEFDDFHEGVNAGCDCIHPPAEHDMRDDKCLNVNPTFGQCPCEVREDDDREPIQPGDYHYYNRR